MNDRVIWLDSSPRRANLITAFGEAGDWFSLEITDISSAAAVFVHATDAQFTKPDSRLNAQWFVDRNVVIAGRDADSLLVRLKAFRAALRAITSLPAPLIIVYTGDPGNEERVLSNFKDFTNNKYPNDLSRCACIVRDVNVDRFKDVLKSHLDASSQSEGDQADRKIQKAEQAKSDLTCAIDLVSEVVTWLSETQKASLPKDMEEYRAILAKKFGEDGEGLVNELMAKVTQDEQTNIEKRVKSKVDEKQSNRVEVWEKNGMLSNNPVGKKS